MERADILARLASITDDKPRQSQPSDLDAFAWPPLDLNVFASPLAASQGEGLAGGGIDGTIVEADGRSASDLLADFPIELSEAASVSTPSMSLLRDEGHAEARLRATLSRPWRLIGHRHIDQLKVPALISLLAAQSIFIFLRARPEPAPTIAAPLAIQPALTQPANTDHPAATVVATPSVSTPVAGASPIEVESTGTVAPSARLVVTSEPSGARAFVDGRNYGTTPATVSGLSPGAHHVVLEGPNGRVTELVNVTDSGSVRLVVNFAQAAPGFGWVSVALPIDVQIFEGGRLLGVSQSERIMLGIGTHRLELVNDTLGYRATEEVLIEPDKVARIASAVPNGTVNINALPWAEVSIDGERVGETPLANLPLRIGAHEVVFRHPELGTQSRTVIVTTTSRMRLGVDLRK